MNHLFFLSQTNTVLGFFKRDPDAKTEVKGLFGHFEHRVLVAA